MSELLLAIAIICHQSHGSRQRKCASDILQCYYKDFKPNENFEVRLVRCLNPENSKVVKDE